MKAESKKKITPEIVRLAIWGTALQSNPRLRRPSGSTMQKCMKAIEIIQENREEFDALLWQRLAGMPLTKYMFGPLIRRRLNQNDVLNSPIVSVVFDEHQGLESRLSNLFLPGVQELRKEYRGSNNPEQGDITDQQARNMLAEILVLDFLVKLGFSNVRKVVSSNDKAHIDISAEHTGRHYAIEVTRKQEITDWETLAMPWEGDHLEDCDNPDNHKKIRNLLIKALKDKEKQFSHAISDGTISGSVIKVVAIKPSDYGFAECIDQATRIAGELLSEAENWPHVDCIWLVPNVEITESRWLCSQPAHSIGTEAC